MAPQKRNSENRKLPQYWRYRKGFYWFRTTAENRHLWDGKVEFKLGRTESEAFETYAKRVAITENCETLRKVFTRYRLEILPTKSASTQKQRKYSLPRLMTAFGDLIPHELTPSMIYRYMDHVKKVKSEKWANTDLECLSHALSCAVRWGTIDRNPVIGQVRKFSTKGRKHRVTNEDLLSFAELLPRKWQLYISLKLCTRGRRKGELLRIKLTDCTEDGIEFRNNKNPDDIYLVEWTPNLKSIVNELKSLPPRRIGSAYLFVNRDGKPYINETTGETSGFDSMWQRWMKKAEEKGIQRFTENDLRKKAIEGESLQRAQELLRHTTSQTTKKHYSIRDRIST